MLVFMLTIILITMGLVMMAKERADALNRTLALQDELTGLHNRRAIHKLLEQQLALARRNGQALALLIVDIDHFKKINDDHGHLSGDLALRTMADGLRRRLRGQDIAGRWGGEEFIVILPGTDAAGACGLAENLRRSAEQARLVALDGRPIGLTISIGVHALDAASGDARDDMIAAADRALYLAKQNGRNRVEAL
jgi:diguanylate cyclase (GGDEF)-like protein